MRISHSAHIRELHCSSDVQSLARDSRGWKRYETAMHACSPSDRGSRVAVPTQAWMSPPPHTPRRAGQKFSLNFLTTVL